MDEEKIEALLIDYIDGTLPEEEQRQIIQLLSVRKDVYQQYVQLKQVMDMMGQATPLEPSTDLDTNFSRALGKEIARQDRPVIRLQGPILYRVAAAVALLLVGGGIGFWINAYHQQQRQLEAMRREMETTKRAMLMMMHNTQSASQRLEGVNVAYKMEKADDEIVKTLVRTMNEDPNTNVRLAALDALSKFHEQPHVRKALIASLEQQKDPVVQIALIRLMVDMKEKEIVNQLQRITDDSEALPAVKDEAHAGILRLS